MVMELVSEVFTEVATTAPQKAIAKNRALFFLNLLLLLITYTHNLQKYAYYSVV